MKYLALAIVLVLNTNTKSLAAEDCALQSHPLQKCGVDAEAVQKSLGQKRDECNQQRDKIAAEIDEMGLLGRKCASLIANMSASAADDKAQKLTAAGCDPYTEKVTTLELKTKECSEMNESVGRLHAARFAHVKFLGQRIVATVDRSFDDIFADAKCEIKWKDRNRGVGQFHYVKLKMQALDNIRRDAKLEELQREGSAAIHRRDTDGFCEKYFPAPEMY